MPRAELQRIDGELVGLAQGTAAVRLGVGELLVALTDDGGLKRLGFSSLEAYARERCERSGRWARDTRALARRLGRLPLMGAGLRSGQLSWSMVELLARHASPEAEEELLTLARGKTVRQMREHFRRVASQAGSGQGDDDGQVGVADGNGVVPDGNGVAAVGDCVAPDGDGVVPDGNGVVPDGNGVVPDGNGVVAGSDGAAPDEDGGQSEPLVSLTVTMTTEDAWALECTRMLLGHLGGGGNDSELIDSLLAEGMTTLLGVAPEAADELEQSLGYAPFASVERAEQHREWLAQLAAWRDEAEQLCEGRIPRREPLGLSGGAADAVAALRELPAGDVPSSEVELDRNIVQLTRLLAQRDLGLGDGLIRLCDTNGWRRLGYASLGQYARERLGVSLSSAKAHMTLARRARALEPLRAAVDAGEVGFEAAVLVGRIATPMTAEAWLTRAQERTIKHLGEEVATAEVIARTTGDGDQPPPDDETQAAMMALESYVLSGRIFGGAGLDDSGQMSGDGESSEESGQAAVGWAAGQMSGGLLADGAACGTAGQMSGGWHADGTVRGVDTERDGTRARRGAGKVTQRWRVTRDVARAWHALARVHARSGLGGSFVELLCVAVWQSWQHTLGSEVAYADLYARERYRCSSPVCFSRNQTPHHIQFRSRGGDDSPENLTAPCVACHLDGIHAGNIRATGSASALRWEFGREPVIEVQGRVRCTPGHKGRADIAA